MVSTTLAFMRRCLYQFMTLFKAGSADMSEVRDMGDIYCQEEQDGKLVSHQECLEGM